MLNNTNITLTIDELEFIANTMLKSLDNGIPDEYIEGSYEKSIYDKISKKLYSLNKV